MDFWADHGKSVLAIILGLITIGGLIYRHGRLVQKFESKFTALSKDIQTTNETQDTRIDKNCKGLVRLANELHELKESKIMTHPDHHLLTIDCRKEIDKQMDAKAKLIDKDVKSISETMQEIRADMKEDRRVREKQAKQLVEHVVIMRQFKETLAGISG